MRFFVCFFFEIFLELELSPLFSPREFFFSFRRKYERLGASLLKRVQGGLLGKIIVKQAFYCANY